MDTTCLCLHPRSRIRLYADNIVYDVYSERLICCLLVLSTFVLAFSAERNSRRYAIVSVLDTTVNSVYMLECALKVVARGWSQYFVSLMHKFEALMVLAAFAEEVTKSTLFMSAWDKVTPTKERFAAESRNDPVLDQAFSALHILRNVRLVQMLRGRIQLQGVRTLSLALETLIAASVPMMTAFGIALAVLLLFSIIGMQFFSGGMFHCSDRMKQSRSECVGIMKTGKVREWENAALNFDWIGNAMLACFSVITGDGWTDVLFQGIDSNGGQEGGLQNSNLPAMVFFVLLQLVGFIFVTKLLLAVWVNTYCAVGTITAHDMPRAPTRVQLPFWEFDTGPNTLLHPTRHAMYVLVTSTMFDIFMAALVGSNMALMAFNSYMESDWQRAAAHWSDVFFSSVFAAEAFVKLSACYPCRYFQSPWNLFDCFLILLELLATAATPTLELFLRDGGGTSGVDSLVPTLRVLKFLRILKVLRVLRVFKALKSLKALNGVVRILQQSASAVGVLLLKTLRGCS